MNIIYRESGLLNTSQFYGDVQNTELVLESTDAENIGGWIDCLAVLALFVGRMCMVRVKPGAFELYLRWPVQK